jgi:RNA polymerase sigma-70 factor (ECF subfamily)
MVALAFMDVLPRHAPALLTSPGEFRAFYEQALPRVYGYFFHRCGGAEAVAEDLTQETFLAAVGELRKGVLVEAPVSWVLGIARHKLVDHYRSEARRERRLEVAWQAEEIEARLADADDEEARRRALAALDGVPALQRAALVLRYLDGLSVPEVAAALGRSVEAAESLLARGRESFKRLYMGAGDE